MKNIIALLFILAATFSFSQDENPYEKFKTGTFTYQAGKTTVVIKRTKKKHIEIVDGVKMVMDIEWTSDSTYVLTARKISSPGCLSKGEWIKVKIVKIEGETYTAKFYSENCGNGSTVFTKVEDEL